MVTGIKNWSTTAGNNNSAPPNGAPEGWAPSAVNDTVRQIMAEIRAWYEVPEWLDFGDAGLTYVSATVFRLTGDQTAKYHVGRRVRATGTTPFTIYGSITASSFSTNTDVTVSWDSGSLNNTLATVALGISINNDPIPYAALKLPSTGIPQSDIAGTLFAPSVGDYKISAVAASHSKYLLCDGSAVSRSTYSALFALIGTSFGAGNGTTTFNLPNGKGRSPLIAGQGTTGEGDVTGTDRAIGAIGGYETHTLADEQTESGNAYVGRSAVSGQSGASSTNGLVDNTGSGGQPHNNMHPFITLGNLFIYSGV